MRAPSSATPLSRKDRIIGGSADGPPRRRWWYDEGTGARIHCGGVRWTRMGETRGELTARALVMGVLLGAVLSISNVYVGLRIGWSFGVSLSATVLGYGIGRVLALGRPGREGLTLKENV